MSKLLDRNLNHFESLAALLRTEDNLILMTHVNPDGDALGSLLALGEALTTLGKNVTLFCQGGLPEMYDFLPQGYRIVDQVGRPEDYRLAVLLDCHTLERSGELTLPLDTVPGLVVLDHHQFNDQRPKNMLTESSVIDSDASATGELVWNLTDLMGLPLTPSMATNLFVAISTDTGNFVFSNTTPETLEIASRLVDKGARTWDIFNRLYLERSRGRLALLGLALNDLEVLFDDRVAVLTVTSEMFEATGTNSMDTDGFVEFPRSIKGVDLAMFFRESGTTKCKSEPPIQGRNQHGRPGPSFRRRRSS